MNKTTLAIALILPIAASANPEPPLILDARGIGMGGTATASIDGASGSLYNPASLAKTNELDIAVTISPFIDRGEMPFIDPTTGAPVTEVTKPVGTLASIAAAFRAHEKVAVGTAVNITSAAGGDYESVALFGGADASASLFSIEAMVPVSIRVTDKLDLALAWRATYFHGSLKVPQLVDPEDPTMGFFTPELSGSGVNVLGYSAGMRYSSDLGIEWGLSYRNKVTQTITATPEIDGMAIPGAPDEEFKLATPHDVRAGAAWTSSDQKLQLAADVRYWIYEDAQPPDATLGRIEASNNSWGVNLGGEFWVSPEVPVRLGGLYWTSSTPEINANAFEVPPGAVVGATVGTGYKLGSITLDGAFGYLLFVDTESNTAQIPGNHDYRSFTFSASATYRK